jgi:uncharacterized phiE125 gp8 family phage protein
MKTWLHIDHSAEDTLIDSLVKAHRKKVEEDQNRALITQTWTLTADSFAALQDDRGALIIPKPTLQSITSITYVDTDGDSQTWSSALYSVDTATEPGRVTPIFGESYPSTQNIMNAVTIVFVAGYGTATTTVPNETLTAIKILVGCDMARGDETDGIKIAQMRKSAKMLIGINALETPA